MWKYKNTVVTDITDVPAGVVAFIYKITNNETRQVYYGKKSMYSTRTLPPLKGTRKKRKVTKLSRWADYKSSNKEVQEWTDTTREILKWCYSQREATYEEARILMCSGAMEDENCLNGNILGRFYKGNIK